MSKARYIRFIVTEWNAESRQPAGLFTAAYALLAKGDLTAEETEQLKTILAWFEENLPTPKDIDIPARYIFWFRMEAQECIQRMWDLASVLKMHGYLVEVEKCWWPGPTVYYDAFQVAAHPRTKR